MIDRTTLPERTSNEVSSHYHIRLCILPKEIWPAILAGNSVSLLMLVYMYVCFFAQEIKMNSPGRIRTAVAGSKGLQD